MRNIVSSLLHHPLGRTAGNACHPSVHFFSMANDQSVFNACQEKYPVTLKASEDQQTLYSNYEAFELDFGQVKLPGYVPGAVARGETPAYKALFVHFHGGALVS